jgi:endonuclease-3
LVAERKLRIDSLKVRRKRALDVAPILTNAYPDTDISLDYENPLQLMVATILSAQCTDKRVNQVTPDLFARYPRALDYAESDREELETLIHSTGFFRNKAKNIQGMGARLVDVHGGVVPDTMDELIKLPGVARKTANVVLSNAFKKAEGVVVDTHIKRVAGRLGLTGESNPVKIERDLMEVLPRDQWIPFAFRLILHGRARCGARRPDCANCELAHLCPSSGSFD